MRKIMRWLVSLSLVFPHALFRPPPLHAGIPCLMNFQGRLTDASNNPRTGAFDMTFRIYDAPSGGTQLWTETWSGANQVPVSRGVFTVQLGSLTPIPVSVFDYSVNLYLETSASGETLSPRQKLCASAFSFNAASLSGKTADFFVSTAPVNQTLDGVKAFSQFPAKSGGLFPSAGGEFATKGYADLYSGPAILGSTAAWTAQQTFRRALTVSNTHFFVLSGNIGLGTTRPSSSLDIFGGSLTIRGANAGLAVGGSNLVVATAGNAGIGTSLPTNHHLKIYSAAGTGGIQLSVSTGTARLFEITGTSVTLSNAVLRGGPLVASGIFGIGTTSTAGFPWSTTDSYANVNSPAAGEAGVSLYKDGSQKWKMYVPGGSDDLNFRDTVTDRLTLQSGGRMGAGTASPSAKTHIFSAAGTSTFQLLVTTGARNIFEIAGSSVALKAPLFFPDGGVQNSAFAGNEAPELSLGAANAEGAASSALAADSSIALFDAVDPAAIGTAATGTADAAARGDHIHPAADLGTGAVIGQLTHARLPTGAGAWNAAGNLTLNSAGYSTSFASSTALSASALFNAQTSTASLGALTAGGILRTEKQFLGQPGDSFTIPSFSWFADNNLGMYQSGTLSLSFVTEGGLKARITSSGDLVVGYHLATSKFDLLDGSVTIRGTNAGLAVGGSNFTVTGAGNAGVGTSQPAADLHIHKTGGSSYPLLNISTGATKVFEVTGSSITILSSSRTILTGGYLGIGTLVPSEKLHLNGKIRFVSPVEDAVQFSHAKTFVGREPDEEAFGGLAANNWVESHGESDYGILFQFGAGNGDGDSGGLKVTDDGLVIWGAADEQLFKVVQTWTGSNRLVMGIEDDGKVGINTNDSNPSSLLDIYDGYAVVWGAGAGLNAEGPATFAGNVGIGTDNPSSKFLVNDYLLTGGSHLAVSTGTSRLFEVYGSSVVLRAPLAYHNGTVQVTAAGTGTPGWTDASAVVSLQTSADQGGVGTAAPAAKAHIFSPAGSASPLLLVSTGTTRLFEVTGASVTVRSPKVVLQDGDIETLVGIGSTGTPWEQLHVFGRLKVGTAVKLEANGSYTDTSYYWNGGDDTGMYCAGGGKVLFSAASARSLGLYDGDVEIGTTIISSKFDIFNGSVTVRGSNAGLAAGGSNFAVGTNGNVGIGTVKSGARLHVWSAAGNTSPQLIVTTGTIHLFEVNRSSIVARVGAFKAGGGSWTDFSDARLKKNIQKMDGALDKLLQLRGVAYEWIEPEKHGGLAGPQRGMIAQEVEKVFPEWVGTDASGRKFLTFTGFEALALEAIKSLNRENGDMEKENGKLERKSRALESDLAALRHRIAKLEDRRQKPDKYGKPDRTEMP